MIYCSTPGCADDATHWLETHGSFVISLCDYCWRNPVPGLAINLEEEVTLERAQQLRAVQQVHDL